MATRRALEGTSAPSRQDLRSDIEAVSPAPSPPPILQSLLTNLCRFLGEVAYQAINAYLSLMTLIRFASLSEGLVVWGRVIFKGKGVKKYPEYSCPLRWSSR